MRIGFIEIILIALLVFLLFGANKFPSIMKNLADGLNVFKKEIKAKKEVQPVKVKSAKKTVAKKPIKKAKKK